MSYSKVNDISTIFLYEEPATGTLDLQEIKRYLEDVLDHPEVRVREEFVTHHVGEGDIDPLARRLAGTKIRDLNSRNAEFEPMHGEVEFEKKVLRHPERRIIGILYDGFGLMGILQSIMPEDDRIPNDIHIVFTGRLFGTFDGEDRRYHARVIVCGYPSIISTTGIVEAPAKPREFYRLKQRFTVLDSAVALEEIKERFRGRFIDYDDGRLTEVMKGYAMQAVFYHLTHEPFCDDKDCRLYNAHWQEEVINAQLGKKGFCARHEELLERSRRKS